MTTNAFIQYKNTVLCMDFYCECGAQSHFDGDFMANIECPVCGQIYIMPTFVKAKKWNGKDTLWTPPGKGELTYVDR